MDLTKVETLAPFRTHVNKALTDTSSDISMRRTYVNGLMGISQPMQGPSLLLEVHRSSCQDCFLHA